MSRPQPVSASAGLGLPSDCARRVVGLVFAQKQGRQQQPIVATTTSTATHRTSTAAPTPPLQLPLLTGGGQVGPLVA